MASLTEFDTRRAASSRGWLHRPWHEGLEWRHRYHATLLEIA